MQLIFPLTATVISQRACLGGLESV